MVMTLIKDYEMVSYKGVTNILFLSRKNLISGKY